MIDDIDKFIKENYPNILINDLKKKKLLDNNVLVLTRAQIDYISHSHKYYPNRIEYNILNYHDWIYIKRDGTIRDEFEVLIKDQLHFECAKKLLNHKFCQVIITLFEKSYNPWHSTEEEIAHYRKGWLKMKEGDKKGFNFVEIYNFISNM